jgi:small subunit ribosomal protein S3
MSVVKRIIQDSIERVKVDELLMDEYEQAGYGGITLTKTPLGAQINLFAMRPGRVIGKRGRAIKAASSRLEMELGLPNPQITVVEVEVPEMNPQIMASRIANALERGVHFRRAIFWSLRRIMDSGAIGCEVLLKGPLRSARSRFEKVVEGYVPKSGDPALRQVRSATMHVKMKRGVLGVTVNIVPPDAKFPDKVNLEELPEIEYQPPIAVEPETPEAEAQPVAEEPTTEGAEKIVSPAQPETKAPEEEAVVEEAPTTEEVSVEETETLVEEEVIPEEKPEKVPEVVQPIPEEEPTAVEIETVEKEEPVAVEIEVVEKKEPVIEKAEAAKKEEPEKEEK